MLQKYEHQNWMYFYRSLSYSLRLSSCFFFCLVTEKAGQTYPDNLSGSVRQFNYITSRVTVRKDQPSGLCLAEALLIDEEVAEKAAGHCNH